MKFHVFHVFHFFLIFFIFIIEKASFYKKIIKIIKNSSFSPEAPDASKTNVLGKVLRPKSWKSVNSWNFTNFQLFLKKLLFSEKVDFYDFSARPPIFTHFGPKKVVLEQWFQPRTQNWWNWANFNKNQLFLKFW